MTLKSHFFVGLRNPLGLVCCSRTSRGTLYGLLKSVRASYIPLVLWFLSPIQSQYFIEHCKTFLRLNALKDGSGQHLVSSPVGCCRHWTEQGCSLDCPIVGVAVMHKVRKPVWRKSDTFGQMIKFFLIFFHHWNFRRGREGWGSGFWFL